MLATATMSSRCKSLAAAAAAGYLDVSAVGREVHLHHKAGDVPAAVDAVQLRAQRQVVEVDGALRGAHGQVAGVWTEPEDTDTKGGVWGFACKQDGPRRAKAHLNLQTQAMTHTR